MPETQNATDNNRAVISKSEDDIIILEDDGLGDFVMPGKEKKEEKPEDNPDNNDDLINFPDGKEKPLNEGEDAGDGLKLFAKALHENGVLPNLNQEEFDGSLESLISSVGDEIANGIKEYKNALPRELQYAIENYEEGVPLHTFFAAKAKTFEFGNIKESDLGSDVPAQKKIVKEFLKIKGFNDVKIDKMIGKYEELGDLEEEAVDSLRELRSHFTEQELKVKKDAELKKAQDEETSKRTLSQIKTSIDKKEEIIPGVKINKLMRDKIYNSMTEISGYSQDGKPYNKIMQLRAKDPVNFDIVLHYLTDLGVFDGKWDALKNIVRTDTGKQIDNALKNRSGLMNGSSASNTEKVKSEDILKGLRGRIPNFQIS